MVKYFKIILLVSISVIYGQTNDFLVDSLATTETVSLFKNLKKLNQDKFMFGHQDATAYGVGWNGDDNRSDVKSVCGDYPAVYGWDLGDIGKVANLDGVNFERMKRLIKEAYERGGINTISMHLDNPVTNRNSWDNTVAVNHILPGGSSHDKFLATLDQVAEFLNDLKSSDGTKIPIIFRPFHEHTQTWSWWGSSACTDEEYIQLWKMTVEYLRDTKNVHNLLYTISPQDVYTKSNYFFRYPGDKFIDVWGMDNYSLWTSSSVDALGEILTEINQEAVKRGKITALTEVGIENVSISTWWTDYLLEALNKNEYSRKTSWALVWRNQSAEHHSAPYPGHDSAPNFVQFYSDPTTQFESDLPNMYELNLTENRAPKIESANGLEIYAFELPLKITLNTNEQASIRYSFIDEEYEQMPFKFNIQNGGNTNSTLLNIHDSGEYEIYFRAKDLNDNVMDTSHFIKVIVDTSKIGIKWNEYGYTSEDWKVGTAPLGFGDVGNNKIIENVRTSYFRKEFTLSEKLTSLGLLLKGHDGIAAYINGNEVARLNLDNEKEISYDDYATAENSISKVIVLDEEQLNYLQVGENILSVEVHKFDSENADISIDARLFNNEKIVLDLGDEWQYYDNGNEPNLVVVDKVTSLQKFSVTPTEIELYQNYPNPFNPNTTISYHLPNSSDVKIKVYDLLGKEVDNLVNAKQTAGRYTIQFDASNLSSGVYIIQLQTAENMYQRKMLLLK